MSAGEARRAGAPLDIARVDAGDHREDVRRLMDGRVEKAWGSGRPQRGDETVTVDLGAPRRIGAVVFRMGAFAFGFPRELAVNKSEDRVSWSPVWQGATVIETLRAALKDPGQVPVTIFFEPVTARYLRLRQTGHEADIPWWIAELQVLAP
jgi:hypothetical protein